MISRNLYKDSRQLGGGLLDERENRLRKLALTVHFRTVASFRPFMAGGASCASVTEKVRRTNSARSG